MMTLKEIRELLRAQPFVPFRLHLTDGSSVAVPHPDFAWTASGWVMVVREPVPDDAPPWVTAVCDRVYLMHVARVEMEPPVLNEGVPGAPQ